MNLDARIVGYARRLALGLGPDGEIRMADRDGTLSMTVKRTRRGTAVCTVTMRRSFFSSEFREEFRIGPKDWSPRSGLALRRAMG